MQDYIYLDYHATTPVDAAVADQMMAYFNKTYANSSGSHNMAWEAKDAITKARKQLADLVKADKKEIYFTSSASEANSWVFKTVQDKYANDKRKRILISPIEHKSVINAAKYYCNKCQVDYLTVDTNGYVDLEKLEEELKKGDVFFVSVMHANNEIGSIQDIQYIGDLCKKYDALFHSDAVQTFAKYDIDLSKIKADFVTWSAHKFYGPKGVGAAFFREGIQIAPLILGGGHERGLRAGTHNTPGIVGMAYAASLCKEKHNEESKRIAKLRDQLQLGLENICKKYEIQYVINNNQKDKKLYNNLNISFQNLKIANKSVKLRRLCFSSASSCSSGSQQPSYVLAAIGLDNQTAANTMRLSLGRMTTDKEIQQSLEIFESAFQPN